MTRLDALHVLHGLFIKQVADVLDRPARIAIAMRGQPVGRVWVIGQYVFNKLRRIIRWGTGFRNEYTVDVQVDTSVIGVSLGHNV